MAKQGSDFQQAVQKLNKHTVQCSGCIFIPVEAFGASGKWQLCREGTSLYHSAQRKYI